MKGSAVPKIVYTPKRFNASSRAVIDQANVIFAEYQAAGYVLTLRQLYYQFVSRALLPNNQESYKRLGSIINDARLAGEIDWDLMEDRTRNLISPSTWSSPAEIIKTCSLGFRLDLWADQPYRPEVWIEKDALAGVFERVCDDLRLPYFSCRGYTSQSEMWSAGQRLLLHIKGKQVPYILHFGDHDPSGLDMTRDITDRLSLFMGGCKLIRLALNMNQVQEYNPPPNPAKISDSRAEAYIREYGSESWELDALEPDVLADLVREAINSLIVEPQWEAARRREAEARAVLSRVSASWDAIVDQYGD